LQYELGPILEGLPHVRMVQASGDHFGFNVAHAELFSPWRDPRLEPAQRLRLLTDEQLEELAGPDYLKVFPMDGAIDRLRAIATWSRTLSSQMKKSIDDDLTVLMPETA